VQRTDRRSDLDLQQHLAILDPDIHTVQADSLTRVVYLKGLLSLDGDPALLQSNGDGLFVKLFLEHRAERVIHVQQHTAYGVTEFRMDQLNHDGPRRSAIHNNEFGIKRIHHIVHLGNTHWFPAIR